MDKSCHGLKSQLLKKQVHKPRVNNRNCSPVNCEPYDSTDRDNLILNIQGIKLSPCKILFFIFIAPMIFPILLAKWYASIRRLLFFNYTSIENASYAVITGICKLDILLVIAKSKVIVPIKTVSFLDKNSIKTNIKVFANHLIFRLFNTDSLLINLMKG